MMETTIMTARLLALLYVSIGVGLLISRAHYQAVYRAFFDNPALAYLGGLIALFIGFVIVSIHNEWDPGWPLLVTVFGWVVMIKGVILLAFPRVLLGLGQRLMGKAQFMVWEGVFALGLGLVFAYLGFWHYCPGK
jgi:hypothetical protein